MRNLMYYAWLKTRIAAKRFASEERGASDMVAVIVLVVVVIAVAITFRETIVTAMTNATTALSNFISGTNTSGAAGGGAATP